MAIPSSEPLYDHESGVTANITSSGGRGIRSTMGLSKNQRTLIKPMSEMSFMEKITAIVAVSSISLALLAMIVEGSTYVVAAGILQIIMGSYAYYQQTQIALMNVLKNKTDVLEVNASQMQEDNTRMTYYLEELEGRVEDLFAVEDALEVIEASESKSMDALEKDTFVNNEIVQNLKYSPKLTAIETLISYLYSRQAVTDEDEATDIIISSDEASLMIHELNQIQGLRFFEDRFRDVVVGNSVESIVDVLQNLLDEEVPGKKQIFRYGLVSPA